MAGQLNAGSGMGIKKGLDRNPAPFKIQYPMKNRCKYNSLLMVLKKI